MFVEKLLMPFTERLKDNLAMEIGEVKKIEQITIGEQIEKLSFKELTTTVNIRGIFKGRIVITADEEFVKIIGDEINKKYGESMHHYDALSELADVTIHKTAKEFPEFVEHAQIDMPVTICSENGYMKNFEFQIWTYAFETNNGTLNMSVVYAPGTGIEDEE